MEGEEGGQVEEGRGERGGGGGGGDDMLDGHRVASGLYSQKLPI